MYIYIIYTYKYILHAHPLKQLENMQAAKRQSLQLSQITWAFCALIPRFLHAQWSHAAWDDWNDIRMVSDTKSLKQTRVRRFKTKTKECHHQAAWFESCTMGRVSLKLDAVQRANRKRRIEPWKSPYRIFPKIPSPSNLAYVFDRPETSWIIWKSTTYQQLKYGFIEFNCFQRFSLSSQHHTNPLLRGAKLCNSRRWRRMVSQQPESWTHWAPSKDLKSCSKWWPKISWSLDHTLYYVKPLWK